MEFLWVFGLFSTLCSPRLPARIAAYLHASSTALVPQIPMTSRGKLGRIGKTIFCWPKSKSPDKCIYVIFVGTGSAITIRR